MSLPKNHSKLVHLVLFMAWRNIPYSTWYLIYEKCNKLGTNKVYNGKLLWKKRSSKMVKHKFREKLLTALLTFSMSDKLRCEWPRLYIYSSSTRNIHDIHSIHDTDPCLPSTVPGDVPETGVGQTTKLCPFLLNVMFMIFMILFGMLLLFIYLWICIWIRIQRPSIIIKLIYDIVCLSLVNFNIFLLYIFNRISIFSTESLQQTQEVGLGWVEVKYYRVGFG